MTLQEKAWKYCEQQSKLEWCMMGDKNRQYIVDQLCGFAQQEFTVLERLPDNLSLARHSSGSVEQKWALRNWQGEVLVYTLAPTPVEALEKYLAHAEQHLQQWKNANKEQQ